ncbi:MAG: copper chaperone PCu(A)C [Paracoccaceae bacterium]|nr:copper chaperone PCu(A)C [Paracoccaceae bacterium]
MTLFRSFLTAAAITFALPAFAHDGVAISDPYAIASSPTAASGAAFMMIENHSKTDDRLLSAASDVAEKVELHTHKQDANGVMQMVHVSEGFVVPAGGHLMLERGGNHVMLMGLRRGLADGDEFSITLTFERAGEIVVDVPVDLKRKPEAMGDMDHSHSPGN